jgi:hypothetical protein
MSENNLIFAELSDETTLTHWQRDQDYGPDLIAAATAVLDPDRNLTVAAAALCDGDGLNARLKECPNPGTDLDPCFHVCAKQDVPGGATIIPPAGVTEAEIGATDPVVYRDVIV